MESPLFRILTIGDPHFKSDNGETTQELTEKIIELVKDRLDEINAVAILGDILHRHEKIDLHPYHRAMKMILGIHEILNSCEDDKFLYIIIGNHDRSNNRVFMTDEHVFEPLKLWNNTFVADTCIIHEPFDDFRVLLMPYVPPGDFEKGYKPLLDKHSLNIDKDIDLVLAHQEFHGAKMNTITSNEGDPWDSLKPLCVSGHIHDYQQLKSNMYYVGTPIQHGFADIGQKTVSIFTFEESRKFIEERVNLNIKGRTTVKGSVKHYDDLYLPTDEYFVKVKLSGTKQEIKNFIDSKKYKIAIEKGIVFQFLELPTVDVNENFVTKIETSVSFSDRVKDMINNLDEVHRESFLTLFKNF